MADPQVRPTLCTFNDIDEALRLHFAGIQITLLDNGLTTVPVVVEETSLAEEDSGGERSFPRITIQLLSYGESTEEREGDSEWYKYQYDDVSDPPEWTMRAMPDPFRLMYQVSGWVINDTMAFRELIQEIQKKFDQRDYLTIDSDRKVYVFQDGDVAIIKSPSTDEIVLQAAFTYVILAELEKEGEETVKTVKQLRLKLYKGLTTDFLWREIVFDDTTATPQ